MARFDRALAEYVSERLRAAEGGETEALYDLGLLYSTGQGVNLNLVEAHKWFNLAAMMGLQRAAVDRSDLARDMSTGEIADAQRQAREWQSAH
ncbi:MAG: sel1 repeat family protein [Proteobacteria bacterium]|nr:sel1 repeat family protein [Pseudomonadota bacterium]